jgi:7-cyano-7-deazaguanine synthase
MTHVDPKAVILLSGGLDSTVTAAIAKQDGYRLYCLTISYGQRHHVEVERARAVAQALSAPLMWWWTWIYGRSADPLSRTM